MRGERGEETPTGSLSYEPQARAEPAIPGMCPDQKLNPQPFGFRAAL